MTVQVSVVLQKVTTILQDAGAVRWPTMELVGWMDSALLEISRLKPSAFSQRKTLQLVEGTAQSLPDDCAQIMRVIRNVVSAVGVEPVIAGHSITPVAREILDAQMPYWHDQTKIPYGNQVIHLIQDPIDPECFYVFPGNDGTGRIEVIASMKPIKIEANDDGNGSPIPRETARFDDYSESFVPLEPKYESTLIDGILYRAYSKDMGLAGASQRAAAHFAQFNTALGTTMQAEMTTNVNMPQSAPDS